MASNSHNRQPTANRGGASSIPTPANSGSTGIFGGSTGVGPEHGKIDAADPKSTSTGSGGQRRQSQESAGMFGNLSNLKRDSQDQGVAARKSSMSDQMQKPSMIGQMWQNFTKGSGTGGQ